MCGGGCVIFELVQFGLISMAIGARSTSWLDKWWLGLKVALLINGSTKKLFNVDLARGGSLVK